MSADGVGDGLWLACCWTSSRRFPVEDAGVKVRECAPVRGIELLVDDRLGDRGVTGWSEVEGAILGAEGVVRVPFGGPGW